MEYENILHCRTTRTIRRYTRASFFRCSTVILFSVIQLVNYSDCQRPNFEAKDKQPYNYYRVENDPDQVKPDTITQENLFGWLNLKNSVKFKLWTRRNPHLAHEIKYQNLESLRTSNFDPKRVTKILLHGYADTANEVAVTYYLFHMRDAYLHLGDVNVIIVDYSLFMIPLFYWSSLPTVAADRLTEFLNFMVTHGSLTLSSVHLIGFSWGAHVAGLSGNGLKGLIGRITGLDPAGPTFHYLDNEDRLDKSDAQFVDIIHTNGGKRLLFGGHLGLPTPLGHVDIYPNGGQKQIGCPQTTPIIYETLECSHGRSARYFIESITSPLAFPLPCPCDNFDRFVRNQCECTDKDVMSFMGEHMPHSTRGIYQLITRSAKPFGQGPSMNITLPNLDPEPNHLKNTKLDASESIPYSNHNSLPVETVFVSSVNKTITFSNQTDTMKSPQGTTTLTTNKTNSNIFVVYKNVTYNLKQTSSFNSKYYPNDDIVNVCLSVLG